MSRVFERGFEIELLAGEILKSVGYEVLYEPQRMGKQFQIDRKAGIDPIIEKKWNAVAKKFRKAREGVSHVKWDKIPRIKKAKEEFYKIDALHHKEFERMYKEADNGKKKIELITSIIGKSLMPQQKYEVHKKSDDGFNAKFKTHFKTEDSFQHTYVDYFCKKDDSYFIFDIKHKTYKENTNLNRFSVTDYEVLNYNRIVKEGKAEVKIMIVLEKNKKLSYKIFDWEDFVYSENYDPNKTSKTSIRLKVGFDINRFKNFN